MLDDILAKAHHARDLQNKVIVTSLDRDYDYSRPGFKVARYSFQKIKL